MPTDRSKGDWETFTPEENLNGYQLVFWDDNEVEQGIWMSREEYIALKEHLAKMRGLIAAEGDSSAN